MGEILKFRLSTSHDVSSLYVPFDSSWTTLRSLCYSFLNVDYSIPMESITIVDANDMDKVVEKWTENKFDFHELNFNVPEQDLVFVVHVEHSFKPLPPPSHSVTSTASSHHQDFIAGVSSIEGDLLSSDKNTENEEIVEFSSALMIMKNFGKDSFSKLVSHEVPQPNVLKLEPNTEFLQCCARGDDAALKSLLENADITAQALSNDGITGLYLASEGGHLSILDILCEHGLPMDCADRTSGMTPLSIACLRHHDEIATWLLDKKCDMLKTNKYGATPLHYVCYNSMTSLLSAISKFAVDITSEGGYSLLHYASGVGSYAFVEHLVMLGANVNCWDNEGNYPIHFAAAAGTLESVFLLIEVGKSPVDCLNEHGQTPFLVACRSGNVDVAKWLASAKNDSSSRGGGGANFYVEDSDWNNALHAAAQSGNLDLIEYLTSIGISLMSKSKDGKRPVDVATNESVVTLLKKLEAEIYVKDENLKRLELESSNSVPSVSDGNCHTDGDVEIVTPQPIPKSSTQHVAIKNLHGDIIGDADKADIYQDEIVENNQSGSMISVDNTHLGSLHDDAQVSKFFTACVEGDTGFVKWYISQGLDVSVSNEKGSQGIHFAAQGGRLDIVQLLFEAGADVEATNNKGLQPMALACACLRPGDYSLVKWLASQGAEVFSTGKLNEMNVHAMYFVASCSFDCPDLIKFLYQACPLVMYYIKQMNKCEELQWSMLHMAALRGTVANVKEFFDIGMRVGARLHETMYSVLHCATQREDASLELIRLILSHCTLDDILGVDFRGRTAIFHACLLGHFDVVLCLANSCSDAITIPNVVGNTCLHAACQSGNHRLASWIRSNYPALDKKNRMGCAPDEFWVEATKTPLRCTDQKDLHNAFRTGKVNLLKSASELYDLTLEVLEVDPRYQCPFLHNMAAEGHKDAIVFLVEKGVSLHVVDSKGWSPLHYAVVNGEIELMRYFVLDQGMSAFETCLEDNSSCLHLALRGHAKGVNADFLLMVKELLDMGLDVNCQDAYGNSPTHLAAAYLWLDMILLLRDYGANFHIKNEEMMCPLHELIINAHDEQCNLDDVEYIIDQLIASGCRLDVRGRDNYTPFHISCMNGNVRLCNYLFECGSNIRLTAGTDKLTAVHIAALEDRISVVEWLISRGLRYDSINVKSETPADLALASGRSKVYHWLVTFAPTVYSDRFSECLMSQLFWAIDLKYFDLATDILEEFLNCAPRIDICTDEGSTLMHAASAVGHFASIEALFDRGLQLDMTAFNDCTPLHTACLHENVLCVKALVNFGSNVRAKDTDGNSCLHMAVEVENTDIARIFCNIYDSVDLQNNNGWTPLHCCCSMGKSLEMLALLLQHKASIFKYSYDNETPFYLACKYGNGKFIHGMLAHSMTERHLVSNDIMENAMTICYNYGHHHIAQWLEKIHIENGMLKPPLPEEAMHLVKLPPELDDSHQASSVSLKVYQAESGFEGLFDAIRDKNLEAVKSLLQKGLDVNACDPSTKMTALHVACLTGYLTMVQLLVNKGAKRDSQNVGGLTPLHIVCDRQYEDIALFLLGIGVSLRKVCNNGNTVLHMMASRGLCRVLYQVKSCDKLRLCDMGARNSLGQTALHLGVVAGSIDTCDALLSIGCPIDGTDFEGQTPLLLACLIGADALVSLLATKGANVNHEDNLGLRPIQAACLTGNMLVVHTLIDFGAVVNCISNDGNSLLHICCRNGHLLLVKWLVGLGLDLKKENSSHDTPRDCALNHGHDSIVKWIDKQ